MKNLIISFIFILFASPSFAQITLTSANNPSAGERYKDISCDTTNITQGNSGANQIWSFLSLTRIDSNTTNILAASTTPYASQFPTSNIAFTSDSSAYSYSTASSTSLITNGIASPQLVIQYSNPQTYLQYPFTYTNTFSDNFASHYISGTFEVFSTGTITATGDAWGTINLPFGSFPNALRVKHVTITNDSSTIGTYITNSTSYSWFVSGRKLPVFTITYINFSFNGFPLSSIKDVSYSSNVSSGISSISTETPDRYMLSQNYPNPFNPNTKLRFAITKTGFVKLTVFDAIGREVETLVNGQFQNGTYEVDWNASAYAGGTYFYRLQSNGFVETKKMILVK